jgi:hypothetical protein
MMKSNSAYRNVASLLLVWLFQIGIEVLAQSTVASNTNHFHAGDRATSLRERAENGSVSSILALGIEGNEYDQALLSAQLLKARKEKASPTVVRALRKAAAKLGDKELREEVVADLSSDNRYVQRSAFEDACYVEGTDMIVGVARMLADGRAGGRPMEYDEAGVPLRRSSDEYIAAPRHSAVVALSRLVKDESAPIIDLKRITYN